MKEDEEKKAELFDIIPNLLLIRTFPDSVSSPLGMQVYIERCRFGHAA